MPRRRKTLTYQTSLFKEQFYDFETSQAVSFKPGPNPALPDFADRHSITYDPEADTYDVPAFERDLDVDKAKVPKAIYDMHTYWSKKHWHVIREYIRHYLPASYYPKNGGLVLDVFAGSGMTGVASLMEDKPVILIDASPAAAFITHHYIHPVDAKVLDRVFDRLLDNPYPPEKQAELAHITGKRIKSLREELAWLYATKCDQCGGNAVTEYVVYSTVFQCLTCGHKVALFDCPQVEVEYVKPAGPRGSREIRRRKKERVCPHCYEQNGRRGRPDFVISTRSERFDPIPVKVSYICEGSCSTRRHYRLHNDSNEKKQRYFRQYDEALLHRLERLPIPHTYPNRRMMDTLPEQEIWGVKWRRGTSNFQTIEELYVRRNFFALAAIKEAIERGGEQFEPMLFPLTAGALILSKMCREATTQTQNGTYYIPQNSKALCVTSTYQRKFEGMVDAYEAAQDALLGQSSIVSQQSATSLGNISPNSVDYIFTDPPYVDKIQYGELNFVWDAWLGFSSDWLKDEIIVNPVRGKTLEDWESGMRAALAECYRVLKPGRWLSLCYHHPDPAIWRLVQDMLQDVGFEIHTVTELIPLQKSSNQITAEKVVKSDMVLNCRKPRPGERGTNGPEAPEMGRITERVRDILIESLAARPGQTSDRLWSLTVKRLLSRGQMVEHRFADILTEVADRVEGDRWYLKEQYETAGAHDQANEEAAGATLDRFARLRMIGVPADWAATIALEKPGLAWPGAEGKLDEVAIEGYIRSRQGNGSSKPFKLSGNLRGLEFYDLLWFYMTRYMRGKKAGELPRRNLADFLGDYLVRFRNGDQWLYRPPDTKEAADLAADRRSGLGQRIRAFVSAIQQRDHAYLESHRPDPRTLIDWLRHCAQFGLYEEGVILFEGSGITVQQLERIPYNPAEEETGYDAARGYADICHRNLPRQPRPTDPDDNEDEEVEEINDNE